MAELLPLFLKLEGRRVLLVGGGNVALAKARSLAGTGALLDVVAPVIRSELRALANSCAEREVVDGDLDGAWLVIAAAPRQVNAQVAAAAEARRQPVVAVDDPENGSAYCGGVLRRGGVTVAVSTGGRAPALAGLLRQALEVMLPADLDRWLATAERVREQTRRRGVPMAQRRPALLQALLREQGQSGAPPAPPDGRSGAALPLVSLVGAGPGDPGLITVRGRERLGDADVVLHDGLVPAALRALAPQARWLDVSKRAGARVIDQEGIHRLMISQARRGARVVRLKCGDPMLLGRGGEEALALVRAGVPFEIVPGVSSALAAPSAAGIPVTHRGLSSALLVVTGHDDRTFREVAAHGGSGGALVTLVVLMGLRRRDRIAAMLMELGWSAETPAAVVLGATTSGQHVWIGSLGRLGEASLPPCDAAGTLVIGQSVALAAELAVAEMPARARAGRS